MFNSVRLTQSPDNDNEPTEAPGKSRAAKASGAPTREPSLAQADTGS